MPIHASLRRALTVSVILSTVALTACQSGSSTHGGKDDHERIKSDPNESFSSAEYGVKASPRVTDRKIVRKGGGREQVGKPYKVRGIWYYPKDQPGYVKSGKASWYGSSFHGRLTANGEVYDMFGLSAAHPTFPLPSYAKVTNRKTGASVVVRVNDRGPYVAGRVMDVSSRAAEMLGYKQEGVGDVKVEYVGKAPLEGDDTATLVASYRPGNASPVNDGLASGVMVASNDVPSRTPAYAVSTPRPTGLPGVRPLSATRTTGKPSEGSLVDTQGLSVGSIIDGLGSEAAMMPLPTPKKLPFAMVASYAPSAAQQGAGSALAALSGGNRAERIEIGLVTDKALIASIRKLVAGHGRLIVDAGAPDQAGSVSLSVDANPGQDADSLLQALWQAGADGAFVLRD